MSVRELDDKPQIFNHFPDDRYRWLELHDHHKSYAYAAIAERGDDMELHLSIVHWTPTARRNIQKDIEWLKAETRRLGKKKIIGIRVDGQGKFDPNLFRFATLFGFTDLCVLQTATLHVN